MRFTAILIRTSNGLSIRSNPSKKTQSSLSDSLLDAPIFFKKGMCWLIAEDMAFFGV